mgnify:CR=1 FL=1
MPVLTQQEQKDIRVAWYQIRDRYQILAEELHRLLDLEETFPHASVYAVKHRLKSPDRLIEKLCALTLDANQSEAISDVTFQNHVDDLLGIRVICLRVSDLGKVRNYLDSLKNEGSLEMLKGPTEKQTFAIRLKDPDPDTNVDIQYSGYSSIHYVVKLGPKIKSPSDVGGLRAELQLRTIFEEAWGEIDHKYRYEIKRTATHAIPNAIESGFKDLALYLQAAAHHAEHLCEEAEDFSTKCIVPPSSPEPPPGEPPAIGTAATTTETSPAPITISPSVALQQLLGFEPSQRTVDYCLRRIQTHSKYNNLQLDTNDIPKILTNNILKDYREIYKNVCGVDPFTVSDVSDLNANIVPLINFALYSMVFSLETTRKELIKVLETGKHSYSEGTCPGTAEK